TVDYDTDADDTANGQGVPGSLNQVDTFGFGALWHPDGNFKVAAIYEIPTTKVPASGKDPADNLFTLQAQAKF
ncbi:MAG TPA: porin, partial [Anaeromyxobacteraceae bacterium]|nr:porin [Anaeromyxobacteraceae bacterium]